MKRSNRNAHCPVNVALEAVGDPWSLLVIRDIVFYAKYTFGEFLASEERITTSVLSDRLATLVRDGILTKTRSPEDHRKEYYGLTEKGLALIPILVELANWGVAHGDEVTPNPLWISATREDPAGFNALIRATIQNGGAVWRGPNSVIQKLKASA